MTPASSYHGGCPTIAELQELTPFMQPPELTSMQQDVIVPNPGYKIEANLWNLNVQRSAREPSPLASLLRRCNTMPMESPYFPTYSKRGASQPADDIGDLNRNASIENLRELQKHSEKLHFEATCCRLWSEGIHTQIMDEQEEVQSWISGMTEDLLRMKRVQPAWIQPVLSQGCPPAQQPAPYIPSQPASSSSASMVPVKPAPMIRNPSMASAPHNAPFPSMVGADPWAEAKMKQQRK